MEKLQVRIIIEILGRPPKNVMEAINGLVKKLGGEKGIKILEQTIHEPVRVKDSKDLYTTFAELTLELDSIPVFFNVIFAYMPAHIELISPEIIELKNEDLTIAANSIAQRLHGYDAIAKRLMNDREIIARKLYEVAPHLFKKPEQPKPEKKTSKPKKKKPARKKKR